MSPNASEGAQRTPGGGVIFRAFNQIVVFFSVYFFSNDLIKRLAKRMVENVSLQVPKISFRDSIFCLSLCKRGGGGFTGEKLV